MTLIIGGGELGRSFEKIFNNDIVRIIEHTDSGKMLAQIESLILKYGQADRAIITSGYLNKKFIGDYRNTDIEQIIDANMTFPIKVINLLSAISYRTRVIVISSSVTFDATRNMYAVYAASKLGLERFVQSSQNGDGPLRIKIIRPARMDTKLRWDNYKKTDENIKNLLTTDEVAQCTLDFLQKDDIVLEIFKKEGHIICNPKPLMIKSI
jgi:NADP-dependent 3-hydroxy acid dehydrogenase YdfG